MVLVEQKSALHLTKSLFTICMALRYYLLLAALLLLGRPAAAQTPARPDSLQTVAAAPGADTVAALHRLFAAQRRNLRIALPLTVGMGTGILVAAEQTSDVKDGLS